MATGDTGEHKFFKKLIDAERDASRAEDHSQVLRHMVNKSDASLSREVELVRLGSTPDWVSRSIHHATRAEAVVSHGRGGICQRPLVMRVASLVMWLVVACVAVLPWMCWMLLTRGVRAKAAAWVFIDFVWDDILFLGTALSAASYGKCIWGFAPEASRRLCALTIDDGPGRDLDATEALLDALRDGGIKSTFFITSDYVELSADKERVHRVMERMVAEGHELANHMPADKPYVLDCARDPTGFVAELERTEAIIATFQRAGRVPSDAPPSERGFKWFRPPSALLSTTMASLLRDRGYLIALANAYSADPWIDERCQSPTRQAEEWHARFLARRMQAGSIAVIHTPERDMRRQTVGVVQGLAPLLQAKGLRAVTLSELAMAVTDERLEPVPQGSAADDVPPSTGG